MPEAVGADAPWSRVMSAATLVVGDEAVPCGEHQSLCSWRTGAAAGVLAKHPLSRCCLCQAPEFGGSWTNKAQTCTSICWSQNRPSKVIFVPAVGLSSSFLVTLDLSIDRAYYRPAHAREVSSEDCGCVGEKQAMVLSRTLARAVCCSQGAHKYRPKCSEMTSC